MKKGFTLAEILITLGIVGVVAVLTIPSAMRNYKNRLYTAQLQKAYSQITNAITALMNEEGVSNYRETSAVKEYGTKSYNVVFNLFNDKYFKLIKTNCQTGADACVSKTNGFYKTMDGSSIGALGDINRCVQTINGAAICAFYNNSNKCTSIMIDVNSLDGPNIAGRDVFSMDVLPNGTLADYGNGCSLSPSNKAGQCGNGSAANVYNAAEGCLTSVIESGWNMEY